MDKSQTYQVLVATKAFYISEQSAPEAGRFVFGYTITIHNTGKVPARLLTRHWRITDANGKIEEVHGPGVIGEHPHLGPGESFQYTSGAVLQTPVGSMQGHYEMLADDGSSFQASIAPFRLSVPGTIH